MSKILIAPFTFIVSMWAFFGLTFVISVGLVDFPEWHTSLIGMILALVLGYLHVKKGMFQSDRFKTNFDE